ncbi:PBECR4 domain-containing protein [Streptobacillus moniliformis]|uniref:PBECR4 domain-containing protein n=1 Tax=Streptobacillus moniliformis TaxID=34105 RepID=UPI0007E3743C|nr:PBECR4 domain-containing protein [Streptobacillus moniliformis]
MEKTYKVQEILNKMKKLNNIDLIIKGEIKEFDIRLGIENIPHLLGLQYMNQNRVRPMDKIKLIINNNLSDEDILDKIYILNGTKKMINVKNRINTFDEFMNNLEKGFIVEKTLESKMNVNYLIVQSNENDYYHLGIFSSDNGTLLLEFDELNKDKSFIKTYFVEDSMKYFDKTNIIEEIQGISRYSEDLEEYIPFSFNEEKNRALLEEYKVNREFNYREFLKDYEKNKEKELEKEKTEKPLKRKKEDRDLER